MVIMQMFQYYVYIVRVIDYVLIVVDTTNLVLVNNTILEVCEVCLLKMTTLELFSKIDIDLQ